LTARRKNIGQALLNRDGDPYFVDLTSSANRAGNLHTRH
jgi:hypothetical protein